MIRGVTVDMPDLPPVTHKQLVDSARRWLVAHGYPLVVTECVTNGREVPDALGWKGTGSTLIECKTSRSDFAADARKPFRQQPEHGVGGTRFFLVPDTMRLDVSELPAGWGLMRLITHGAARGQVCCVWRAETWKERNVRQELKILLSLVRRLAVSHTEHGVSVKCYSYQTANSCTVSAGPPESSDDGPEFII